MERDLIAASKPELVDDVPKSLGNPLLRASRAEQLSLPHVEALTRFVKNLRQFKGERFAIPDFDPWDGGVWAEVLFLLEAPGARAVASGFVSRNNPDETAKNFYQLNAAAGIDRRQTVTWNAVPWYIGTGGKIRPANHKDVAEANRSLAELLGLLSSLRAIVFVGKKALYARYVVASKRPDLATFSMPHPSPLFINRAPGNRDKCLSVLKEVASFLERATVVI